LHVHVHVCMRLPSLTAAARLPVAAPGETSSPPRMALVALCPAACGGSRRRAQGGSSQNQTSGTEKETGTEKVGSAAAEGLDSIASGDSSATGAAGVMLRLIPIASSFFVTFFGTKISTVVRVSADSLSSPIHSACASSATNPPSQTAPPQVFSVFFTSAAPTLIPTINTISTEGTLTAATFMGIGGALYCGGFVCLPWLPPLDSRTSSDQTELLTSGFGLRAGRKGGLGSFAAVKKRSFGIMVQVRHTCIFSCMM
jgi:hypothetical protein